MPIDKIFCLSTILEEKKLSQIKLEVFMNNVTSFGAVSPNMMVISYKKGIMDPEGPLLG